MPLSPAYQPDPQILTLPEGFYDVVAPARFPALTLRFRNQPWAQRVGLGALSDDEWRDHLGALQPLPRNLPQALALRYHGHQFRSYNPHLGDGRGFLHAQLRDPLDGRLLDLGTKGSGQTPWSRSGDGRLTLKGGVREVLATELLEALGVDTSKTFSVFETGEALVRHDEPSPTRACVLVRLSQGHLRIGSFQRLAYLRETEGLRVLLRYAARLYLPEVALVDDDSDLAEAVLRAVARRVAAQGAGYFAAGFVHGVLNTDNINISGESFDYGPWRFLPRYDPDFVAAYFDESGLYAFGRQGEALLWNLQRLAQALAPLVSTERAERALCEFLPRLYRLSHRAFLLRLGLASRGAVADALLVENCLCFLAESALPYERLFFDWYGGLASEARARTGSERARYTGPRWESLLRRFGEFQPLPQVEERLRDPLFAASSPAASLVIDEVEGLWRPIAEQDDWRAFHAKVDALRALGRVLGHTADSVLPRAPAEADAS